MRTFIYADKFFLASGVKNAGYLEITDGLLVNTPKNYLREKSTSLTKAAKWIAPGLVDTLYSRLYES